MCFRLIIPSSGPYTRQAAGIMERNVDIRTLINIPVHLSVRSQSVHGMAAYRGKGKHKQHLLHFLYS